MELHCESVNGIESIKVNGRLTVDTVEDFRTGIEPLIRERCRIVFDLEQMEYIDSTGLGALVAVLQRVSDAGGRMAVAAIAPKPNIVFGITRADRVFRIFPSVGEALQALQ